MVTNRIYMTMKHKTIPAGQFKAKCLALLDEVERGQVTIVVTKRGKPVARVSALPDEKKSLHGSLIHEADDAFAPVAVEWDAMK